MLNSLDTTLVGIFISLREIEIFEDNITSYFTPAEDRKIFPYQLPLEILHVSHFSLQ